MTRSRKALVDDFPGVTRDRIYGDANWDDTPFTVVDTGGFSDFASEGLGPMVRYQVAQAIEEADAIIMLFDGREGITTLDQDLVTRLRQSRKPVFYGVNKIDGPRHESLLADFSILGIGPLYPISAEHRYGVGDLMDALTAVLSRGETAPRRKQIRLAVIGRPNVGKSSFINRLLGDERLIVSEVPGTTRDSVDTVCTVKGEEYLLVDTAGIRRKKKVKRKLEKFSIIKALKSLDRCHIALVLMDAKKGITDQDVRIAGYPLERGRASIILLNKWDLVDKDSVTAKDYVKRVKERLNFLSFAPVLTISALTGLRALKIFDLVKPVYEQYTSRVGTGQLNRVLETTVKQHQPPLYRGRRIKLFYGTQTSICPPTFVCFVNHPEAIHFSYERYIVNRLREALGLDKTPIKVLFRGRERR
jgi:GTP-binding protein